MRLFPMPGFCLPVIARKTREYPLEDGIGTLSLPESVPELAADRTPAGPTLGWDLVRCIVDYVPQHLRKVQKEAKKPSRLRLWLDSFPGTFALCFVLGLALSLAVTLAGRVSGVADGARLDTPEQQAKAQPHIQQGNELLEAELFAEAFGEFTKAAELVQSDPRPHYGLGSIYHELDRLLLAEEALREALRRDPQYTPAKLKLCSVLYERGEHEESVRILKSVEKTRPNNPAVLWQIARNELRDGHPEEAILWFRKYVDRLPGNAYGLAHLGRALSETGDYEGAEEHYRRALQLDSRLILGWLWLGQLLVATDRRPEAETALAEFRRLRDLDALVKRCERALLRRPDNLKALIRLSQARASLGEYRKALIPLERAMQLEQGNAELERLHGEISRRLREEGPPGS